MKTIHKMEKYKYHNDYELTNEKNEIEILKKLIIFIKKEEEGELNYCNDTIRILITFCFCLFSQG